MSTTPPKATTLDEAALRNVAGGMNEVRGGVGNDLLSGTQGDDKIFGANPDIPNADGNDTIFAGSGNDEVHGLAGNDAMQLGDGNDKGFGGTGNDSINAGAGSDEMFGGDGNDWMTGGEGDGVRDYAAGGEGDDVYVWAPGDGNDHFDGGNGKDALVLQGVTFDQLQAALTQWGTGYQLSYNAQTGGVSFLNGQGQPATMSGELNIAGQRLEFMNIESIVLAPGR